jgi:hypothetical protein
MVTRRNEVLRNQHNPASLINTIPTRKRRPAETATPAPVVPFIRPLVISTELAKISPEERHRMICDAAYLRAERRGFAPGHEVADWLEAESEIDALLGYGRLPAFRRP